MIALFALVVAASSSTPPMVSGEPQVVQHGARLLDADTQAKLAELDTRRAALQPSTKERTFRVLGAISLGVALVPVAGLVVGAIVGVVIGAAAYGFGGALLGFFVGALGAFMIVPWPLWVLAASLAVFGGISLNVAHTEGAGMRRELSVIRAERHVLLHPTPMTTLATF